MEEANKMGLFLSQRLRARRRVQPGVPWWRRISADKGSYIVEAAVGSLVMMVAVIGVIASMGAGIGLTGASRQRSSGTAVAQKWIELVHNVPYDQVALLQRPTHNNDSSNPDYNVTTVGCTPATDGCYTVAPNKSEPILVNVGNTQGLNHIENSTVGKTTFTTYQYVTWVKDDSAGGDQAYKRVVVVVVWLTPVGNHTRNTVTQSTFVSKGTVSFGDQGPTAAPVAAPQETIAPDVNAIILGVLQIARGEPTQQPNPNGPCPEDSHGPNEPRPPYSLPTVEVLSGAGAEKGYVNTTNVQMRVKASDSCHVTGSPPIRDPSPTHTDDPPNDIQARFSNCLVDPNATPTPTPNPLLSPVPTTYNGCAYTNVAKLESDVDGSLTWSLQSGDGLKTIYIQFVDANGLQSATYSITVELDTTKPTTPSSLTKINCTIVGNDRTVSMTWGTSTDRGYYDPAGSNLVGYRYYRSIGTAPFITAGTTTFTTAQLKDKKTDGVRYMVRAYDKAGNESLDSNYLSVSASKEPC